MQTKTITILGTGYVGISSAAVFASAGYKIYLVDINQQRLQSVREGKAFFFEEGLDPLLDRAVRRGDIIPTDSYETAVSQSDIIVSCVGTPDNPDGSSNLSYVFAAAKETALYIKKDSIFVQKSTVPVGTGEQVEALFAAADKQVHYVSNPEFLRESTAVRDTLWFDRIVVGGSNGEALDAIVEVYKTVQIKRDAIAALAGVSAPRILPRGEYILTSRNSAELTKVTANAFLAMKITFANSIAKLADATDADINEVMDAVGADPRIGRSFLNAGRGYGGGCFPKDISGLISSGNKHGVELDIMHAVTQVNESMPGYIAQKLKDHFDNNITGKRIAVLGLAFKAGTSDTRRSPAIMLANLLAHEGAIVQAYDPEANGEARPELNKNTVKLRHSLAHVLEEAEVIVVATDWSEFVRLSASEYNNYAPGAVFVDCMNRFTPTDFTSINMPYIGVGRR